MKIDAILFDIDGVLVDSDLVNFEAFAFALSAVFNAACSLRQNVELGSITSVDKIRKLLKSEPEIDKLHAFKKIKLQKLYSTFDRILINNDVNEMFNYLKECQIKIGLVSNAGKNYVAEIIKILSISDYVDLIVTPEHGYNGKPSGEMYLAAIKMLDINASNVLIFEDSDVGLLAAAASGANVIKIESYLQLNKNFIIQKLGMEQAS